jgi:CubicO group peptidase (beta-lactamase class C family)
MRRTHRHAIAILVAIAPAPLSVHAQAGAAAPAAPSGETGRRGAASLDSAALQRLLRSAGAAHSDAIVIRKDGEQVGAWTFGKPRRKIEAMSATKSIVSLAIGRLVTTGAIRSVDEPVFTFYPEWKQGRKQEITLRHLLDHTSGLQNFPNTGVEIYPSPDFVRLALAAELSDPPGTRFSYNNKAVNLLAGIVQKASGKRMDTFLKEEVFAPMGITDIDWTLDKAGNPHGMAGLQILPEDLAKLGQLVLDRGEWRGRRIISREWMDESLRPSKLNPRCALLWWLVPERTTWTIDDAHLAAMRAAGVDSGFVRRLEAMRGSYTKQADLNAAAVRALGDSAFDIIPPALGGRIPLARAEYGRMIGYEANGYLGQYLVIYPEQRLVAVRMVAWFDGYDPKTDGFVEFHEMARAVAR